MAYLRQQEGKRIGPLPLLVATATLAVVVLLLLAGGGGGGATPKQQQQQQRRQVVKASRWAGVPEVSLKQQVPSWAGCPQIPCEYGEMKDGVSDTSLPFHSQFGEDEWLFSNLFYNKINGFYLEMGAMDGTTYSNTRWLQQAAGWKGMLIEACPAMAAQMLESRKDSIGVHAAVCGEFRTVHWHSANSVGGIFEFMAEGFKETFHQGLLIENLPEVPCVPMQFLLDKFGIGSIDFWSLDVEGAELEVLKTVDFSRLSVKVLMVELDGHNPEKDQAVTDLLAGAGFAPLKKTIKNDMSKLNTVFIHRDAWPHLAQAPNITEASM